MSNDCVWCHGEPAEDPDLTPSSCTCTEPCHQITWCVARPEFKKSREFQRDLKEGLHA